MSEYASIKDAFGVVSFASQEPPILRGQVGEIQGARHNQMASTIASSNPFPETTPTCGVPGAGLCVGAGHARNMERCPAGVTCPACATVHHGKHHGIAWKTLSRQAKLDLFWLMVRDVLESDLFLIVLVLLLLYFMKF